MGNEIARSSVAQVSLWGQYGVQMRTPIKISLSKGMWLTHGMATGL